MSMFGRFVTYFIVLLAIAYVTEAIDKIAHVGSNSGEVCYDGCEKRGGSYYYCHAKNIKWDYCSPSRNVDSYGKTCKKDSPCGKHGKNYRWCYNTDNSWGYCGSVERKLTTYTSSQYKKLCLDDCTYYASGGYYYCTTASGWDYCSPIPNVSYRNKMCNSGHPCDLHGNTYYWCNIDSSWDYCGKVEWDTCGAKASRKRANRDRSVCLVDNGNHIQVDYVTQPSNRFSQRDLTAQVRNNAYNVIGQFDNGMLTTTAGTLTNNDDWRLDMQGTLTRDDQRYYNIQLQSNQRRQAASHRTTSAAVLVPAGDIAAPYTGQRRIRNALLTSFNGKYIVVIEVIRIPPRHDELRSLDASLNTSFEKFNSTILDF